MEYIIMPGTHHRALILQNDRTDQPTENGEIRYVAGTGFRAYSEGSVITLGSGGGAAGTLDQTYDNGRTITVDAGSVVLTGTNEDTAVLSIIGDGDSAGALISFSHTTTSRNDLLGSSSNWSVTGAGAATFTGVTLGDDEAITLGAASDATIQWVGASNYLDIAGATNFDGNMTIESAHSLTITGTGGSTLLDVTAGDVTFQDGSLAITDADNAETVTVINNTATTIGAAASAALVQIESTSLTTGAAVNVQLTEGTLNGGFYYSAWDATAGARVFSVGENGDVTITGTAGSDALTITNGDVAMSDGSLTITDADNAPSVSVTNNTATTSDVVLFTGSGIFTGTGASSFVAVTQSGLTTGSAVGITTAALTSGKAIEIVAAAQTSGSLISVTGGGANLLAAGELVDLQMGAATVGAGLAITTSGVYTGAGLLSITADSATTGVGLFMTMDGLTTGTMVDLTTTGTVVTTGEVLNIAANSATTCTGLLRMSATALTDGFLMELTGGGANVTATGGGINLSLGAATDGTALAIATTGVYTGAGLVSITADSATTGVGVLLSMDGLTTGTGVSLTSTGTIVTTGEVLSIAANSATTCTGLVRISGTGLTDGFGMEITTGGANQTATGGGINLSMGAATAGTGIAVATTGIYTGSTGLLGLTANSATTGTIAVITANGLTTGTGLLVTSSGTITSAGEGLVNIVGSGITSGDALKIDLTEGTLSGGNYINCYDDTAAGSVFTVAEDGVTTIAGAAATTALTLTAGDLVLSDGAMASAVESVTLGAAATALAVDSNVVAVTGDGGGNTVATITGGVAGQILVLIFVDGNVTITNDDSHAANTVDLEGAGDFTSADDSTLTLVYDGTSWYQIGEVVN